MDILGVGGWELLAILLIMVVVAGPKRMIAWSYQLGRYVGVLRKMWVETAKQLQKEFDAAGVDVKVPQELPTRQSIAKEIGRAAAPLTKPLEETMQELKVTAADVRQPLTPLKPADIKAPAPKSISAPPPPAEANGNGTGSSADFGTWSSGDSEQQ